MTASINLAFTTGASQGSTLLYTLTQSGDWTYNVGPGGNDMGADGANPYNACVDPAGAQALAIGIYSDFPNHTTWSWIAGTTTNNGSPLGYPCLNYGYGEPGWFPEQYPPTPYHPQDSGLANVTLTFNISANMSQVDGIDWLIETWGVNTATPTGPFNGSTYAYGILAHEIGFYPYMYAGLQSYLQGGTHNFDATLSDGMNIRCYTVGGGTPAPFVVCFPVTSPGGNTAVNMLDGNTHTVRLGEILGLMEAHGAITSAEWITGYSCGPEVYAGTGSAVCSVYKWNAWPFT